LVPTLHIQNSTQSGPCCDVLITLHDNITQALIVVVSGQTRILYCILYLVVNLMICRLN
jgi:hypothetical protein